MVISLIKTRLKYSKTIALASALSLAILMIFSANIHAHQHEKSSKKSAKNNECQQAEISCAKTITSAVAPNGDLWRLWVVNQQMWFAISKDNGSSFSPAKLVTIPAEKISARNENRPKIAFDDQQGVYLSWAMSREKKFTADIRFSYSLDGGKSFSAPTTINNDNLLAGHSFNEMHVTNTGDVSIVWLDGRHSYQLRKQGKKPKGSALYLAQANPRNGESFSNVQLANDTCVCCRIAIDVDKDGKLAILWRHIYGDNIREFALLTLAQQKIQQQPNDQVIQVSHDHWQIEGCPHQGGGISINAENTYHLVWFNLGSKGKGIFYAHSKDQGQTLTSPIAVGQQAQQAVHPHVISSADKVTIVWMEFNGEQQQLWYQQSTNGGLTFAPASMLISAKHGGDRPFIVKNGNKHIVSWLRYKQDHWTTVL